MVQFMVLSAPRSASTWVANWLTTDKTLCLHDPLLLHAADMLDAIPCDRILGLACTALPVLPELVEAYQARKVIVHRDAGEVDRSLETIGLSPLGSVWKNALESLSGMHIAFDALFDPARARPIYEYLTGLPFDKERHALLVDMHIEPQFERVQVRPERARDFRRRVEAAFA